MNEQNYVNLKEKKTHSHEVGKGLYEQTRSFYVDVSLLDILMISGMKINCLCFSHVFKLEHWLDTDEARHQKRQRVWNMKSF